MPLAVEHPRSAGTWSPARMGKCNGDPPAPCPFVAAGRRKSQVGEGRRTPWCNRRNEPVLPGSPTVVAPTARTRKPPSHATATPRSRNNPAHGACGRSFDFLGRYHRRHGRHIGQTRHPGPRDAPAQRMSASDVKRRHPQQGFDRPVLARALQSPRPARQLPPTFGRKRRQYRPVPVHPCALHQSCTGIHDGKQ